MTQKQMETIVGMISGLQGTLVVLVSGLERQGVAIDRELLARLFEEQAAAVPEEVANREIISMVYRQVAQGLSAPDHDPSPDLHQKLH